MTDNEEKIVFYALRGVTLARISFARYPNGAFIRVLREVRTHSGMAFLGIDIGCISLKAALVGEADERDLLT